MYKNSISSFCEHEAGFRYKVEYSKRKTIQISIITAEHEYVLIKAPKGIRDALIKKELDLHKNWIIKRIDESRKIISEVQSQGILNEKELSELRKKAKDYIPGRVSYYAQIMGIKYNKIYIRAQNTRWGSCSTNGNLNFNCLLMLTPPEVIDSVIVHELAHRIHMNHSKAFYEEIYKYYPEYKRWNKWLKEQGKPILMRMKMGKEHNNDQ